MTDQRKDHESRSRIDSIYEELDDRQAIVEDDQAVQIKKIQKVIAYVAIGSVLILIGFGFIGYGLLTTQDARSRDAKEIARSAELQAAVSRAQRYVSSIRNCSNIEEIKADARLTFDRFGISSSELPRNKDGRIVFQERTDPPGPETACEAYGRDQITQKVDPTIVPKVVP